MSVGGGGSRGRAGVGGGGAFEGDEFGLEGMDRGGQVGGHGDMGAVLTLEGSVQGGKRINFGHKTQEVAGLHLDALVNGNLDGDEVSPGGLSLVFVVI